MQIQVTKINKEKLTGECQSVSCPCEDVGENINILIPEVVEGIEIGDVLEIVIK